MPLGTVMYEADLTAMGKRLIWVEARIVDRLRAQRGAGEDISDVILRLVQIEAGVKASR